MPTETHTSRVLLYALVGSSLFLAPLAHAQPLPPIRWYTSTLNPIHITSGEKVRQGFGDRFLYEQIVPNLKQYDHDVQVVPLGLRELMLLEDQRACSPAMYKTPERVKDMYFSLPTSVVLSPGVFVENARFSEFSKWVSVDGTLRFTDVLRKSTLRLGAMSGRSYGPEIDQLLGEFKASGRIHFIAADGGMTNLLNMLKRNRHDLVLGNPFEQVEDSGKLTTVAASFRFFPVSGQPSYRLSYVACTKSPLGMQVIARVNEVVSRKEVADATQGYFEQWLTNETRGLSKKARALAQRDHAIK